MANTASTARLLRFDVFELDVHAGELRKNGTKLRLQGQPLQVLAVLLNHAGDVVTREELRNQIWSADTFVDFDHSLHNAIARLREVLGDSAETPRYIETLPRRGYRFIAPVQSAEKQTPQATAQSEPAATSPIPANPGKLRTALVLTFLTLAAVAAVLWMARSTARPTIAAPALRSIAVLPLENLSGDPSQQYFVDGMTDELITELAKVGALRVVSHTSVMRYKGTKKTLPEIARELGVEAIIEGSVMRSGQRVRVTAQLLQAQKDQHLWAETYDRDLGDVLKLQSEVAQTIAQQVRVQLTPQQQALFRSAHPVNPRAYDAYVRGRFYMNNEYYKVESLEMAQKDFEEALRIDPTFAPAYSGLADSYLYLGFTHALPADVAYRSATEAVQKALQLDDTIGEAHDTMALLSWRYKWDWDAADKEFNVAIALSPSYSCAREDHSVYLGFMGRRAEALAEIAKSRELDPSPVSAEVAAASYYGLRDYEQLTKSARDGIAAFPNEWGEHYYLGVGYEGTGKVLEAMSEYQRAIELSGGDEGVLAALAHAFAVSGRKAEAQKMLRDLERKAKSTYVSPYTFATIYAGLGEKDQAFAALEKAYAERSVDISWYVRSDLRLDNLRSDPRFHNLLRRMGLTTMAE